MFQRQAGIGGDKVASCPRTQFRAAMVGRKDEGARMLRYMHRMMNARGLAAILFSEERAEL
jgi:hypothetical protein